MWKPHNGRSFSASWNDPGVWLFVLSLIGGGTAQAQPVTLQPVVQQATLDGPHRFGTSFAIEGAVIVVGAPGDYGGTIGGLGFGAPLLMQGWVYIYAETAGQWVQQAAIPDPSGANGTNFGLAVAVGGNRVVVGAPSAGTAYVYLQSGASWNLEATLKGSDSVNGDEFGGAVAIQGDTLVVGAYDTNAAYVFTRIGGAWTQQAKLTPPDAGRSDDFGSAVALSNGTALIGASFHNKITGAAYVFAQSGGEWTLQAELQGLDTVAGDYFGVSVALDGDTALVGAYWKNTYRGAAYVFTRSAGVWTQQAELTAPDQVLNAYFGSSVALSGNIAVVDGQVDFGGAAYVFQHLGTSWRLQTELRGDAGVIIARQVAVSGNRLALSREAQSGIISVLVDQIPAAPLVLNAASLAPGPIARGEALALIGDLGPDDAAIAVPSNGQLPTQLGGVQVFFDGVAAALYYAQKQQVNVQAPFELTNPTVQIRVLYNNQASWTSEVAVQAAAPGIFHAAGAGSPQALLLNQDGTLNSPANPAPRGSVVALWATGGGAYPSAVTGSFTPLDSRTPLSQPVSVMVGGAVATLSYQGVAPAQSSAVFQVNFTLPADAPAGSNVPLILIVGTAASTDPPAGTTIAVK